MKLLNTLSSIVQSPYMEFLISNILLQKLSMGLTENH
jgi:hypothetical protein